MGMFPHSHVLIPIPMHLVPIPIPMADLIPIPMGIPWDPWDPISETHGIPCTSLHCSTTVPYIRCHGRISIASRHFLQRGRSFLLTTLRRTGRPHQPYDLCTVIGQRMAYNIVTDCFHVKKLYIADFLREECTFKRKRPFALLSPYGGLQTTYALYLRLTEKRVLDFLLMII